MSIIEIWVSILAIAATLLVVATLINLWRAPDALTRANLMGPIIGMGIPFLVVAKLSYDWATVGFDWHNLVKALLTIFGLWVIVSVGSFYMGRAIYGVTVTDPGSGPSLDADSSPNVNPDSELTPDATAQEPPAQPQQS